MKPRKQSTKTIMRRLSQNPSVGTREQVGPKVKKGK